MEVLEGGVRRVGDVYWVEDCANDEKIPEAQRDGEEREEAAVTPTMVSRGEGGVRRRAEAVLWAGLGARGTAFAGEGGSRGGCYPPLATVTYRYVLLPLVACRYPPLPTITHR